MRTRTLPPAIERKGIPCALIEGGATSERNEMPGARLAPVTSLQVQDSVVDYEGAEDWLTTEPQLHNFAQEDPSQNADGVAASKFSNDGPKPDLDVTAVLAERGAPKVRRCVVSGSLSEATGATRPLHDPADQILKIDGPDGYGGSAATPTAQAEPLAEALSPNEPE